ncbi:MAG: acetyl-CoA acetyltransferase [Thermodesulfobacteriota bacterium]
MNSDSTDNTPVIIGVGQITEKDVPPDKARSPLELMLDAVKLAAGDAGIAEAILKTADHVMVTTMFTDDGMSNPAGCLADAINAGPAVCVMSGFGGTSPQCMLAHAAGLIADGKARLVVMAGAEAQRTKLDAGRLGLKLNWGVETNRETPALFSTVGPADGATNSEHAHSLSVPPYVYPLFENALRKYYNRSLHDHLLAVGRLMSRFSAVAAANPLAWFPQFRTPEEIITVSPANRNTALPYTKLMNSMLMVNQSAALIVTSAGEAKRLGVGGDKPVYLHGYAEAHDHWHVLTRENYYSSPAVRAIGDRVFSDTGLTPDGIDYFDIYSCFPSSIQITRDMLGLSPDADRDLTVTGGLPYFGGPGNNYVMHAIARMVEVLRARPGSRGLVTGNSFYLTKHCAAVYSTAPVVGTPWREDFDRCQRTVDDRLMPEAAEDPTGTGLIETYTVTFNQRNEPDSGIIIGRTEDGRRFAAFTPKDPDLLAAMTREDFFDVPGTVSQEGMVNTFKPL